MNNSNPATKPSLLINFPLHINQGINKIIKLTMKTIKVWAQKTKQRKELARLTDYQLRDLGISRQEAEEEAKKVFWK